MRDRASAGRLPAALAVLALVCGLVLPAAAQAAELAWTSERVSGTMASGKRTSKGVATFRGGEKAAVSTACDAGPLDADGWATSICEAEIRFDDGSRILLSYNVRHDEQTLVAKASGRFKGGNGRFEGIEGTVSGTGLTGRMDWVGSYTLPKK